jgi:hypothetical protein
MSKGTVIGDLYSIRCACPLSQSKIGNNENKNYFDFGSNSITAAFNVDSIITSYCCTYNVLFHQTKLLSLNQYARGVTAERNGVQFTK